MKKSLNKFNLKKMHGVSSLNFAAIESLKKQQFQINDFIKPSLLDSILKQQNQLSKMSDSSGFNTIRKQQEQFSNTFNSFLFDGIKNQQMLGSGLIDKSILSALHDERPNFKSLVNPSVSVFDSVITKQNKLISFLNSTIIDSIKIAPSRLTELSSLIAISQSFQNQSVYADTLKTAEQSFSFQLLQELAKENISLDDSIDLVQDSFSRKLEKTQRGLISFEGMAQIFFNIMLFIYVQSASIESEENILKKIEELESSVMNQMLQLLPPNDEATYYIVKRTVNLRAEFNTKSTVISVLYPNQRVELIKRNKKWIYVKYFDHISGIPKMGWVYKKYLKMEIVETGIHILLDGEVKKNNT